MTKSETTNSPLTTTLPAINSDGSLVDEGKATANVALRPSHTPGPASAKAPVDVCFVGEASKAHRRLPREDAAPSTQTPAELEDHPGTTYVGSGMVMFETFVFTKPAGSTQVCTTVALPSIVATTLLL